VVRADVVGIDMRAAHQNRVQPRNQGQLSSEPGAAARAEVRLTPLAPASDHQT
jgi:hypothetical protein